MVVVRGTGSFRRLGDVDEAATLRRPIIVRNPVIAGPSLLIAFADQYSRTIWSVWILTGTQNSSLAPPNRHMAIWWTGSLTYIAI